jgi:hypothetical protein
LKRISAEAFTYYVELGSGRSYEAVAQRYGVSKVTIVKHAAKENWQGRLREAEQKAREEANKKAVETLAAVRERQLQEARILERRALEALKVLPPEKAAKAAVMLNIAWKHELLLLGEPSERTELNIEEVTRREMDTLLRRVEVEVEDDGDQDPV